MTEEYRHNTLKKFRDFIRNINKAKRYCILDNNEKRIDAIKYSFTEYVYIVRDFVKNTVTVQSNLLTVTVPSSYICYAK